MNGNKNQLQSLEKELDKFIMIKYIVFTGLK